MAVCFFLVFKTWVFCATRVSVLSLLRRQLMSSSQAIIVYMASDRVTFDHWLRWFCLRGCLVSARSFGVWWLGLWFPYLSFVAMVSGWHMQVGLFLTLVGALLRFSALAIMSFSNHNRHVVVDDIEHSFGFYSWEQAGVVICSSTISGSFIGFTYSLVAKVFMDHLVNCDGFVKIFSHLWKGTEEVLIKEINFNRF